MSWILWVGGSALLAQWDDGVRDRKKSQQMQVQELSWGEKIPKCMDLVT